MFPFSEGEMELAYTVMPKTGAAQTVCNHEKVRRGNVTDNVLKFKSDVGDKTATTKPNNTEQENVNKNDMCFKRFHSSNATQVEAGVCQSRN